MRGPLPPGKRHLKKNTSFAQRGAMRREITAVPRTRGAWAASRGQAMLPCKERDAMLDQRGGNGERRAPRGWHRAAPDDKRRRLYHTLPNACVAQDCEREAQWLSGRVCGQEVWRGIDMEGALGSVWLAVSGIRPRPFSWKAIPRKTQKKVLL